MAERNSLSSAPGASFTFHTVASLAKCIGGEVRGPSDLRIISVESLEGAGPEDITFISSADHARKWPQSRAAAAIVTQGVEVPGHDSTERALIVVPDAELALIAVLELFQPPPAVPEIGVHPTAFVHADATVSRSARIGPHVSIDRGAAIGEHTVIHAGARIYADVTIGENCVIHANAVVRERCTLGNRVILHQSVSIGADGFGYRPALDGRGLLKMPHLGHVVIEDDVEIGANTCVDRGKFPGGPTVIGAGTKIDNLVQIAHNCRLGRCCVIAGMSGLAGSVVVGDGVQIGAQAGVADQIRIGAGARIGAQAGVMRDVAPGETVLGVPAAPAREALRIASAIRKLPRLIEVLNKSENQHVKKSQHPT